MMTLRMGRRRFVGELGKIFVAANAGASLFGAAPAHAEGQDVSAEQWMDAWMNTKTISPDPLYLSRFADPIYFLTRPISWKPNSDQAANYQAIEVPVGFVTDLASIPRIFWSMLRPDGEYAYAAIIHDYLYWTQSRPREVADNILLLAMNDFGIARATTTAIYEAVRLGGRGAWDENTKLRLGGEKRVLKQFPQNPTTRWSDWKKRPEVFA